VDINLDDADVDEDVRYAEEEEEAEGEEAETDSPDDDLDDAMEGLTMRDTRNSSSSSRGGGVGLAAHESPKAGSSSDEDEEQLVAGTPELQDWERAAAGPMDSGMEPIGKGRYSDAVLGEGDSSDEEVRR